MLNNIQQYYTAKALAQLFKNAVEIIYDTPKNDLNNIDEYGNIRNIAVRLESVIYELESAINIFETEQKQN